MSDFLHIVCPECLATNRLSASRLSQAPKCGRCHAVLFSGQPITFSGRSFEQHIKYTDIPVLVDFWANWCGPCKMMAPAFAQAAQSLEPKVRLAKLDTETEPEISSRFNIRSIPTLIIFKGGRELARQSGAMALPDIVRWVSAYC